MINPTSKSRRPNLRRVGKIAGLGIFLLYVLFVISGYIWVNFGLKNRRITLLQVAFFQWKEVRRDMSAQQLAEAKAALDRKDYSAAYLAYSSAVRNDPDNVETRGAAVKFFLSVGAPKIALSMLDAGLDRAPADSRLIVQMLDILTTTGGDARALELIHGRFASVMNGPQAPRLRTYELLAVLNVRGAEAAQRIFAEHPDIAQNPDAIPILARVAWETRDRLKAIESLAEYVRNGRGGFAACAQLAEWQAASGMADDAHQTAQQACGRFPNEVSPRILLIDTTPLGPPAWNTEIRRFLSDFGAKPESVLILAELAGRRGWVDFARSLYLAESSRFPSLTLLALSYSDALVHAGRAAEARQVLAEIEAQVPSGDSRVISLVRDRQVVAAAAAGDHDAAREFARRLAAAIGDDPGALEIRRRRFAQLQIPEAVAELTVANPATRVSARP